MRERTWCSSVVFEVFEREAREYLFLFSFISRDSHSEHTPGTPQDGPLALIMAPTRELAIQIETETKKIAKYAGIKVVCVVGGVSIQEQGALVRAGCDIIVATPGRMLDCMSNRYVVLNQCNYIVLDEADKMVGTWDSNRRSVKL